MKRALDLLVCLLAAPLLLALGGLIALCVFIDSPGPVLYRSWRVGRAGKPFAMLKFRTMRHGAAGPAISCRDDARYTPLGRWLSSTRFDELPQIINVLRGQMHLVGPRPELREFVDAHPDEYATILAVAPGLTGPAQLRYCDEGRLLANAADRIALYRTTILPDKVAIDLDYATSASLSRDLRVLALTTLLPIVRALRACRARRPSDDAVRAAWQLALVAGSVALTLVFSLDAMGRM